MGSWGNFGCLYQMDVKALMAHSLARLHPTNYSLFTVFSLNGEVVKNETRPLFKTLPVAAHHFPALVALYTSCCSERSWGHVERRVASGCWPVDQLLQLSQWKKNCSNFFSPLDAVVSRLC